MEITLICPVKPTEDIKRVKIAFENLLGKSDFIISEIDAESEISASLANRDDVSFIRQAIHEARIIDAARKRLESNWNGTSTLMHFDKQAAFLRKLKIIDDNQELPPLGGIELIVSFDSEQEFYDFVNWFTPPTKDGKIISS
ncbi:MAG: RNA-binding domain-containing protein [Candidatus Thorarchaeota archaeon]